MAFFVSPLLPFFSLLVIPLMNLQVNALGSSSLKPRSKRSYHHRHSTKLSIKDLALELAKKHVSSNNKLDSTLSTTVNGPKPSLPLQFQFSWNVFLSHLNLQSTLFASFQAILSWSLARNFLQWRMPPSYFKTKLKPEGPKKIVYRPTPPIISESGWSPPPPHYVKVRIRHWTLPWPLQFSVR